jgi:hypothetical protein
LCLRKHRRQAFDRSVNKRRRGSGYNVSLDDILL